MNCHEAEPLLSPYLDSELDLLTAVRVEEHIAACPTCGREYRDLQELHREIAGANLQYSPGADLTRRVAGIRKLGVVPAWRRPSVLVAEVAAAILLLAIPVQLLRTGTTPEDREVIDSHLRSLMASHLVDVPSSDHHTVKPWFQGHLSFSPEVRDLSTAGFPLVGGRLEIIRRSTAAAIVYRRRDHVINLFISPSGQPDSNLRGETSEGYNVVKWVKGGMTYWAVSDLNSAELMQFADLSRRE